MYEVEQISGTTGIRLHVASFLRRWQAEKWAVEQNQRSPETIFLVLTEQGELVSTIGMTALAHILAMHIRAEAA